jgi:ferredoxin-fold anticodon binding domain-containing protein
MKGQADRCRAHLKMEGQHTENLLRRHKGKLVNIKTISGGVHSGRVSEVTNDYVLLIKGEAENETQTYLFFDAMESLVVIEGPSPT